MPLPIAGYSLGIASIFSVTAASRLVLSGFLLAIAFP